MSDRDDPEPAQRTPPPAGQPPHPDTAPADPEAGHAQPPPRPPSQAADQPQHNPPNSHPSAATPPSPPTQPDQAAWPPQSQVNLIRTDNLDTGLRPAPSRGARRLLYRATRGTINPGPSAREKYDHDLHRRIRTQLRGNYRIGIVGKGGVGKTTIATAIGSTLAQLRDQDRIVAIDADTGFGKLGSRIDPNATSSYYELVTDEHLHEFSDIRSLLGANTAGLYVLPGDAQRRHRLTPILYYDTVARLDRFFAITIIDCSATMDAPVSRAIANDLDAAVVVTTPWDDGVSVAHQTLHWLAEHGAPDLLNRTIIILNNSDGNADRKTIDAVGQSFINAGYSGFEMPFDRRLRPGGTIDLRRGMSTATRQQFLEIAATLASTFGDNTHRHRYHTPRSGKP